MPADSLDQQVADLIAHFKQLAADGLSMADLFTIAKDGTAALMEFAAVLQTPGVAKKAIVLAAVRRILETLLPALDVPFLPWWLKLSLPYLRPLILQAALAVAEAWLEKTYAETYAPAK